MVLLQWKPNQYTTQDRESLSISGASLYYCSLLIQTLGFESLKDRSCFRNSAIVIGKHLNKTFVIEQPNGYKQTFSTEAMKVYNLIYNLRSWKPFISGVSLYYCSLLIQTLGFESLKDRSCFRNSTIVIGKHLNKKLVIEQSNGYKQTFSTEAMKVYNLNFFLRFVITVLSY